MKIAIIGAGIQGCSTAMALAASGHEVDLFDQASSPMQRASRWNEGKIHLGYVYGRDPSMATAHRMIEGSLHFFDFFQRHLGIDREDLAPSNPFYYLIPHDSMMSADEVGAHLARCDDFLRSACADGANYIGRSQLEQSEPASLSPHFNADQFQGAFRTSELSIDIHSLAERIIAYVQSHPRIAFHAQVSVRELRRCGGFGFEAENGTVFEGYDHLINTTWESRLALDQTLGIEPGRKWLHRYKLAVHVEDATPVAAPSCTMVLGAYGDFVNFGSGRYYLSWYPAGKIGESSAIRPEEWGDAVSPEMERGITETILTELGEKIPDLQQVDWAKAKITTKGGHIFAWGERDITHFQTGLHERDKSGVSDHEGYYSIDTGKYCIATLYAQQCADHIDGNKNMR